MESLHMEHRTRGLSQEQQYQCQATLDKFIDRHELSGWEMTIEVKEAAPGKYDVRLEIMPPHDSGLPDWPVHEIAAVDASFDAAAEVDRLLESALEESLAELKAW
jgi:hypothetical protein